MPKSLPFCHIWYNDSKIPVVTPVESFEQVISPQMRCSSSSFITVWTQPGKRMLPHEILMSKFQLCVQSQYLYVYFLVFIFLLHFFVKVQNWTRHWNQQKSLVRGHAFALLCGVIILTKMGRCPRTGGGRLPFKSGHSFAPRGSIDQNTFSPGWVLPDTYVR